MRASIATSREGAQRTSREGAQRTSREGAQRTSREGAQRMMTLFICVHPCTSVAENASFGCGQVPREVICG
jgi:hypothetical protein